MPEAQVFGFQCKAYYDSADTPATPTWVEIGVLKDVTLNLGFVESDASIRAAGGIECMEPSLLQIEAAGQLEWINGNAICEFLLAAFFARTAINMLFLTGDDENPDAKGVKGDFKLMKFPQKQELKESVKNDISFKPCRSIRDNFVTSATGVAP